MQPQQIKQLIEKGLEGSTAHVEGDGTHFNAIVICKAFANESRLRKQQLVYHTVHSQLMDGSLHALSLKTFTPDEWRDASSKNNQIDLE